MFYSIWVFQSYHQWSLLSTINIRTLFIKNRGVFGIYPNFQSCKKKTHFLIIPQCEFHQYELDGAKISIIRASDGLHALPENQPISPTRPEEEDDSTRAPYLSRVAPHKSNPRIFSVQPKWTDHRPESIF